MTIEEKTFPLAEPEIPADELETPSLVTRSSKEPLPNEPEASASTIGNPVEVSTAVANNSAEAQVRPWRYIIAGMSLAILAMALGVVLGYLARPALDPAVSLAANATQPVEQAPASVAANPTVPAIASLIADIVQAGGHSKGAADAPVVMVEYSDFQCPFCTRHVQEVAPRLEEAYVKSGQVRFVYKHLVIKGPDSVAAALAAECAGEQDKFWEYHDLLFARAGQVAFNTDNLKAFAAELKLNTATFDQCFDSQKYLQVVEANTTEAQQLGIRGTPGFFVNETPVAGAQPLEVFQQVIEEKLKALSQAN